MPLLPIADCSGVPAPDDCYSIWDDGHAILDVGVAALTAGRFLPEPGACGDPFTTLVAVGAPAQDFRDMLAVWTPSHGPTQASQIELARAGSNAIPPVLQTQWNVELWENAYPVVEVTEGKFVVPDTADLDAINQWVYAHGQTVYEGVIRAIADGSIDIDPSRRMRVGPMSPLGPLGGSVGWSFSVTVEAP